MYENNYPNDYENKNIVDSTARDTTPGHGNFSGQSTGAYSTGYNNTNTYGGYRYGNNYNYMENAYSTGSGAGDGANKQPGKEKKERRGGRYLKKALVVVSLGLFFGICAGVGFFAVESATGALQKASVTTASEAVEPAKEIANTIAETAKSIDSTTQTTAVVTDVSQVAKEVMPAIVSINNTYTQTMTSFFGQSMQSEATAAGSGIIVGESDTELLIVSNYHVVEGADTLKVQFVDGSEAEAQMKGSDSSMDLAVIAVPLENISETTKDAIAVATLGDSDSLTVGEPAIAIGNALGYGQSVTVGVISALDRVIDLSDGGAGTSDSDATFIQTDAAINPGNSGGALLNLKGEVIGINSNKIGGSVVEGMGYAIPISSAKPIIEDLMLKETRAKVEEGKKGYLGISPLTVVDEMAETYGMPKGVYVSQVYEGTAAEAAGIQKGNIITEFDGNKVTSSEDLLRIMDYYSAGDTISITIMQGSPSGWDSKTVSVTLGEKYEVKDTNN
ncbi:MAG: PDZ domain-containing protein [Clostridiales bacterium]|nr:PDZ domain-containing protein [Clostridiales bacterium]